MKPPSPHQQRGTWTVGRMSMQPPDTGDPWVIDYVMSDDGDLRAVTRVRPARGSTPNLRRVIEDAITSPHQGRPHLPARIELTSDLWPEIEQLALPVEFGMSRMRRPMLDEFVRVLIGDFVPPDGHWQWLQPGVSASTLGELFEAVYQVSTSFAWYTLTGREAVAVHFPERRKTHWLRLATKMRIDGHLAIELHLAANGDTLDAWRRGELGDDTIVIASIDQDELPQLAWEECCRIGRQGSSFCPAVTVGARRRIPSPSELQLALEALWAFAALYDNESPYEEGLQLRSLPSGEELRLEVLEPELSHFPLNDGGLRDLTPGEMDDHCADISFVEHYFQHAYHSARAFESTPSGESQSSRFVC